MSDQDEISRLLAEANAQADAPPSAPETPAPATEPTEQTPRKETPRVLKGNSDVLGVAWFNGSLHAATFRRQKMLSSWSAANPILKVAEFEGVVDEMLAKLEFGGTEMFLLLENELFVHHAETIPGFSEAAGKSYLKGRIQRHQQENGPVLWVSQPTVAMKQEQAIILHLLPRSFYDQLNRVLLARHLDLTRIIPLVVPLQYELNKIPAGKDTPVIVVAEVGSSTSVVAGKVGTSLLFSRTIIADINREATRVGVEVNRSLLFAKQHFDCAVDRIWLMAQSGSASDELKAKCGASRKIVVLPTTPIDWLQTSIRLSPQQPINLLAGYLRRKRQHQLIRYSLLAAAWLALAATLFSTWSSSQKWNVERSRLERLAARVPALKAEQAQLLHRNEKVTRDREFITMVEAGRLPAIPARILGIIAEALPESARLTEFNTKREIETGGWSFRVDGTIEAEEEIARDLITGVQQQLEKGPLHARFSDGSRIMSSSTPNSFGAAEIQRFSLEGTVLEK
ncbi:MAG: hypothetical protein QM790_02380 [Nibricoccus sp.]